MNWTKSQSEAIESKAKTLLVSAGAGSGKTTVLTHRLAKRIIAGDSVDDFLVVTFTRAAAGDLRDKLYNALSDALAEQPLNRHLINQLYLLPGARISTIHSFCYDLIKKNFAVLGLSPRMRITDETESAMIARICMEELVDSFYQKGDREFLLLVDNFGGEKSDDALIEKLLSLYNRIRAFHNYREWFEERQEQLVKQAQLVKGGFFDSIYGDKIRLNILFRLGEAKTATEDLLLFLSNNGDSEGNIVPIETLDSYIDTLINATNTSYDTLLSAFSSNKRIPSLKIKGMPEEYGKYLTEEKKRIIGEIKSIKKSFCYLTEQDIYEDFISTIEIGDALKKTIFLFDTLFSDTKKNKAVLDFADLEHYLAQLLEEKDSDGQPAPTALCLRLQRKFKEIYIDEYQDINPLQDHIFRLLSSDKKDVSGSGRFMVGDIKQSIYRFRNAYPDIFVGYKESFPDYNDTVADCARIFLRENFRCAKPIIDFVNEVFFEITNGNRFEKEYRGEELVYAKNSGETSFPVTFALSLTDKEDKSKAKENEAEYIASEIERLVGRQRKEDGNLLKYKDFAILLSAVKGKSRLYENALNRRGIPCITEQNESIFEMPEVMLVLSALKTIDNPTDDISLCALLRSPVYGFTADELYRIRYSLPGLSFYDSVVAASCLNTYGRSVIKGGVYKLSEKKNAPPRSLLQKCRWFIKELNFYRTKAQGMLCYKFLWLFYMHSGLLSAAGGFVQGDRVVRNLLLIYQYARDFENTGFKGLSSFIRYIDEIAERGGDLANAKVSVVEGNYVRIMSIHKSKGLEFPVCFVADTARQFGSKEAKEDLVLSRDLGISCRLKDSERHTKRDTYIRRLAAVEDTEAVMSEELRLLYVALTRAREMLYITARVPEDYADRRYNPLSAKCFADWILQKVTKSESTSVNVYIIPEDINTISENEELHTDEIQPLDKSYQNDADFAVRIREIIEYTYPHRCAERTPAKLSVSELSLGEERKALINQKMILSRPKFLGERDRFGAQKGTANHIFMQFADFEFVDKNDVFAEGKRLLNIKMITSEQYELLSYKHLESFFSSELYREMRVSENIYREKRFSLSENADIIGGPADESILIQGVIDCFFENADGSYTLVDYKTDFLPNEGGEQILVERHRKQLGYYSRAVRAMTGKNTSKAVLYSFSLDKSIEVDLS